MSRALFVELDCDKTTQICPRKMIMRRVLHYRFRMGKEEKKRLIVETVKKH